MIPAIYDLPTFLTISNERSLREKMHCFSAIIIRAYKEDDIHVFEWTNREVAKNSGKGQYQLNILIEKIKLIPF